jgi:hypothetical protein
MPTSVTQILGNSGDFVIDTSVLITNFKFSHFVIGASTATVAVAKIRGVDVSTSRNYNKLESGYVMTAGNGEYFDAIQFNSLGKVEGYFYPQPPAVTINSITIDSSGAGHSIVAKLLYTNSGLSGSQDVFWQIKNSSTGRILNSGSSTIYFVSSLNASIGFTTNTTNSSIGLNVILGAESSNNMLGVGLSSPSPIQYTYSPYFQIYP